VSSSKWRVTKGGLAGFLSVAALCNASNPASASDRALLNTASALSTPNVVHNGTFHLPNEGRDAIEYIYAPSVYKADNDPVKTIPGWTVGLVGSETTGGVGLNLDYLQPPPGLAQNAILGYGTPGSITQTVKTVPGATYFLSWEGASEPNGGANKVMQVLWDGHVVDAPIYKFVSPASENPAWKQQHVVVTAASTSSTLEFADATSPVTGYFSMVGNVALSGDAKMYLPPTAKVAPTGTVLAIVRTATGGPLADPALTVQLYGTYKETSYAPAVNQLMAHGSVLNGQVILKLHLLANLAGKTIPAYATLTGPGFAPVTDHLTIKVS
jgi:hypothetical protein